MDSLDSYDSTLVQIGSGVDDKGEDKLMRLDQEVPCNCHPETCCHFDEKENNRTFYKEYKDGSTISVDKYKYQWQ
jgi:hypothetical protein